MSDIDLSKFFVCVDGNDHITVSCSICNDWWDEKQRVIGGEHFTVKDIHTAIAEHLAKYNCQKV